MLRCQLSLRHLIVFFVLLVSLQSVSANAWEGKGELGYVLVSGNTETTTIKTGFSAELQRNRWKHEMVVSLVNASNDVEKTSESHNAGWRTEYSFHERAFLFGDFRYFNDKFDSFEEIYTLASGVGYQILNAEPTEWDILLGAGYRDTAIESTHEDISSLTYIIESDFKHQFSPTAVVENTTRGEIASENNFVQNVLSVSVAINGSLALKIGYDVRNNSNPEPGDVSTDRILSTNIVYSF